MCLAQGPVTHFCNTVCQGWLKPSASEVSTGQAALMLLTLMLCPLNYILPQVKNSAGINKVNFSCCPQSVLAMALKSFPSGANMQVSHYNVLQQVWLCSSCTHHPHLQQREQELEPQQGAGNLCHQLREPGHAVGRSPCTKRTGLLCLPASINIHLLSETDLVYFFFLGHSV